MRKFVVVAEELHFGRAAQRLGIAQPPLSRAIRQLEHRLGVELLTRTSRAVRLTEAGEVFLHEARKALDSVAAAVRRAQRAGLPAPRLVLTMKASGDAGILPALLAEYEREPDAVPVDVTISGIGEQAEMLRDGRADMAFLHGPHDDLSGFDTEELLTLRQVAVLPTGHRLAGRSAVSLADLDGETFPRWPGMTGDGPLIRDSSQLQQLVALGQTIAVLPESVRNSLRNDLVAVPALDAPLSTVVLAWPERSRSLAVAAFVRTAVAIVSRAPSAVGQ